MTEHNSTWMIEKFHQPSRTESKYMLCLASHLNESFLTCLTGRYRKANIIILQDTLQQLRSSKHKPNFYSIYLQTSFHTCLVNFKMLVLGK